MSPEPAPPSPDSAHDAIYPLLVRAADGGPIGDQNYLLHFYADIMPPAAAFWCVTMYEAEGFQARTNSTGSPSTAAGTHPLGSQGLTAGTTGPTSRSPPPVRFNLASTVFDTSAVPDTPSRSACL